MNIIRGAMQDVLADREATSYKWPQYAILLPIFTASLYDDVERTRAIHHTLQVFLVRRSSIRSTSYSVDLDAKVERFGAGRTFAGFRRQ